MQTFLARLLELESWLCSFLKHAKCLEQCLTLSESPQSTSSYESFPHPSCHLPCFCIGIGMQPCNLCLPPAHPQPAHLCLPQLTGPPRAGVPGGRQRKEVVTCVAVEVDFVSQQCLPARELHFPSSVWETPVRGGRLSPIRLRISSSWGTISPH